jgi:hypothetical protein
MNTLANAGDVRDAGGLLAESAGGATDSQIISSLFTAQMHMFNLIKKSVYTEVSSYSESSGEDAYQQQLAFKDAEARFALSFLPFVLTSSQLQATGFKLEAGIGSTYTHFGNEDDIALLSDFWMQKAMLFLAPYMETPYFDEEENDYFGFESDDGDFTMLAI